MIAPLVVALAVAATPAVPLAAASSGPPSRADGVEGSPLAPAGARPPGDAEPARARLPPALEPPGDAPPSAPYGHSGWRHEIDLGAHSTRFSSKEGSVYAFHSAALGYAGSFGATGPFLRIGILAPLQASQDGSTYATANYYRRRQGGDLLLGIQHRWTVRSAELEAGPGFHATLIYLPARAGYRDFSALPMGAGLGVSLRWRTSKERLSRVVTVGTTATLAYDFRDPAHENDLSRGLTLRLAVTIGLGGRR